MFPGPWVVGEAADCVNIDGDRFGWCQRRVPRPVLSLARLSMKGLRRCLFGGGWLAQVSVTVADSPGAGGLETQTA